MSKASLLRLFLIVPMLGLSLSGCAASNAEVGSSGQVLDVVSSEQVEKAGNSSNEAESDLGNTSKEKPANEYTFDEAEEIGGLFVRAEENRFFRPDHVQQVMELGIYGDKEYGDRSDDKVSVWTGYGEEYPDLYPFNGSDGTEVFTIDYGSGEKLVVFGETLFLDAGVHPVVEEGFWLGDCIPADVLDEACGVECNNQDDFIYAVKQSGFSVLNGYVANPDSEHYKSGFGALICSPTPGKELSWGQYQGTSFVEGVEYANTPYWVTLTHNPDPYGDDGEDAPYLRTKKGYFEVDMSNFDSGVYIVNPYTQSDGPDSVVVNVVK